jgi:hypothetical protein
MHGPGNIYPHHQDKAPGPFNVWIQFSNEEEMTIELNDRNLSLNTFSLRRKHLAARGAW